MTIYLTSFKLLENISVVFSELNFISITFRLILAVIMGGIIGIDRGKRRRGAGFKTYSLVCLASALVMITGEFIHLKFGGTGDVARLGAQVISGIGFLGVGTIIVTGHNQVQGLTTAAGLWACSCMGLAIGIGFYSAAIVTFIIVTILFYNVNRIENYISDHAKVINLYIEFNNLENINNFMALIKKHELFVSNMELIKPKITKDGLAILVSISLTKDFNHKYITQLLNSNSNILFFEEL